MTVNITSEWFSDLCPEDCVLLDVRPILADGVDPLKQILVRVESLSETDVLLIEAPFNPIPLCRMMASKGYESHAVPISEKYWQVFFKKKETDDLPALPEFSDLPVFPLYWLEGVLELDLRRLEPPNPMIAILKVIESGEGGTGFIVRLMRDPIYLYPELSERNWHAELLEENKQGLRVEISKGMKT